MDSDPAGDTITQRSRTGIIGKLNFAPIYWFTMKQSGIEISLFGSEFLSMKHCYEDFRGLRYKLRMMEIFVDWPAYVFRDNKSVFLNSLVPDSVLREKSNSIAYHFVRKRSASRKWLVAYIASNENIADILMKPLNGEKRKRFLNMILHHAF